MQETLLILLLFVVIGILGSLIYLRKNEGYGLTSSVRNYKKAGSKPNSLFTPTRCKCGEVPQQGPSRPFVGCSAKNVIDPMKNFEPSLASRCEGGAYMYSSDPALSQACKDAPYLYTFSNCKQPGFQGRPITFEYLNLSDSQWKNPLACGPYGPVNDPKNIHELPAAARGVVGPSLRPLEQETLVQGDQICIL